MFYDIILSCKIITDVFAFLIISKQLSLIKTDFVEHTNNLAEIIVHEKFHETKNSLYPINANALKSTKFTKTYKSINQTKILYSKYNKT